MIFVNWIILRNLVVFMVLVIQAFLVKNLAILLSSLGRYSDADHLSQSISSVRKARKEHPNCDRD